MTRDIRVTAGLRIMCDLTHWGNMLVIEKYEEKDVAAGHRGEWSTLYHSYRYESHFRTAIGYVWENLGPNGTNVVYDHLIGSINHRGGQHERSAPCR